MPLSLPSISLFNMFHLSNTAYSVLLTASLHNRVRLTRAYRSKLTMLAKRMCSYRKGEVDACSSPALPCTQHCVRHIMYNVDQLLFEHCTAKFSDNTQCCVPVFDICHELPLCVEHARKRVSQHFVYMLVMKRVIHSRKLGNFDVARHISSKPPRISGACSYVSRV
jgi:hypothetical protein